MNRRRRFLVAAGLLAPACSPTPSAHRGRADSSANPPAEAGPDVTVATVTTSAGPAPTSSAGTTGTTEAAPIPLPVSTVPAGPTTTVTVTVPTTPRSTTTFVVPERADEAMGDVEWLIRQTFPETPDKAVRVARCESRLQPDAISPDGANWGVMQVNVVHRGLAARMGYSWDQMLQVRPNLAVARAVYDDAGGGGPWSCA